jgi:Glycosyl transferase 4-like domain
MAQYSHGSDRTDIAWREIESSFRLSAPVSLPLRMKNGPASWRRCFPPHRQPRSSVVKIWKRPTRRPQVEPVPDTTVNSPTVLLLSYHFYPSNEIGARRLTALARYLAGRGIRVVVVSSFDNRAIACDSEIQPGVIAIPVPHPDRTILNALIRFKRIVLKRENNGPGRQPEGGGKAAEALPGSAEKVRDLYFRVLYFVDGSKRWAWRASNAAISASRRYDARLLVASGPPPSALLAGARAASKVGIPYVADFRDPWSDALAYSYPQRREELWLLRQLERWVISTAAAVTSTGEDVAALLKHRNADGADKIHIVRNGYDDEVTISRSGTGGRLSILFAGELYVGRNPFQLLSGIEWLLAQPEVDATCVDVTFMGKANVYAGQSLEGWLDGKRCASVVRILPPQSAQTVAEAITRATLLVNLAQQQPLSVPAKTFEQLASGREILLLCEDDCETARLVSGIRGVHQVDPKRFDKLTSLLLDLYIRQVVDKVSTAPSEQEVAQFSRAVANERFYAIFSSLVRQGTQRLDASGSTASQNVKD